jgi:hypothetical protein
MKGLEGWVGGWLRDRARKLVLPSVDQKRHLLFAVCDHFEPLHGGVPRSVGRERVRAWRDGLPRLAVRFRDSNGRTPRHSFFFPGEQYDPTLVEPLAKLVGVGFGEVEIHLHHDGDTRGTLRETISHTLVAFGAHGIISGCASGPAWGFIHGNWSLSNGRPDGRWCGVDDELSLLHELGCYADFTFPSAPDPCQPRVVNAIYYARDASQRRAYDQPEHVRVGSPKRRGVLMVQGPLAIAWRASRRPLRIEAAALSSRDPPSEARLRTWMRQWVHVDGRPEWTFVKVHAHGAPEQNARVMLGEPMTTMHEALARLRSRGTWDVHYVTAREMYNVARAAMDGLRGSPAQYFDYEVAPSQRAQSGVS